MSVGPPAKSLTAKWDGSVKEPDVSIGGARGWQVEGAQGSLIEIDFPNWITRPELCDQPARKAALCQMFPQSA